MDSFVLLYGVTFILLQIGFGHSDISVKLHNLTFGPYDDEEGEFGYSYIGTFSGLIQMANPPDACFGHNMNRNGRNYFLLVDDGGGCSYYEKLQNAQEAGYSVAIVRSLTSNSLTTMKGPRIDVLGLYVGKDTGEILQKYNGSTGAIVSVHVELKFNLEIYLIPLLIIIGICFVLMILFLGVKYWRTRLHERRNRLTPANLKKIPTKKFKEGDDYDMCAICLEDYKPGEKLRLLPCQHAYHCKCVDPWLTNGKKTCPVCKQQVEKEEMKDTSPSTSVPIDVTETTPLLGNNGPSTSHQATDNRTSSTEPA
ncbi:E3 ubiquitin-protein ligase RNF13-like [Dendronephthya gigantea]|uniref:E3 ubiquitin-protein ligase RNF13-like n=1 Tax=Dendronephthya gigantea TaxID=151771 RepID=UPI00106D1F68|nr:E3 ubiquitin-protein ligase RNF13-like [Dendronephthya gigantea]